MTTKLLLLDKINHHLHTTFKNKPVNKRRYDYVRMMKRCLSEELSETIVTSEDVQVCQQTGLNYPLTRLDGKINALIHKYGTHKCQDECEIVSHIL